MEWLTQLPESAYRVITGVLTFLGGLAGGWLGRDIYDRRKTVRELRRRQHEGTVARAEGAIGVISSFLARLMAAKGGSSFRLLVESVELQQLRKLTADGAFDRSALERIEHDCRRLRAMHDVVEGPANRAGPYALDS